LAAKTKHSVVPQSKLPKSQGP